MEITLSNHSHGAKRIYKILTSAQWKQFQDDRVFHGAPIDRQDGFIHFSAADQVRGTLEKHFAGQNGLLIVAANVDAMGAQLKWEVSRGGAMFPHLYDVWTIDTVDEVFDDSPASLNFIDSAAEPS